MSIRPIERLHAERASSCYVQVNLAESLADDERADRQRPNTIAWNDNGEVHF
jgi:hypothetical protein